ncbi:UNVERIFIED_ORG: hypothetical protein QFZ59_001431 [Bacillus sp. B2I3]|nr:hypothetical protein [Bacillus sp. B2I3]
MEQWAKMQNPFPVPPTRNLNVLVSEKETRFLYEFVLFLTNNNLLWYYMVM